MKKLLQKIAIIAAVVLNVSLLSSCDYFLPAPLGRDNPADDGAQINSFGSLYAGEHSVELIWNWRTFTGSDPSREIVKIRIVHKEKDPPSSMYPLDKNEVQEFSTGGSVVWKDLTEYNDHYFALYRMEKSGTWLSPLYSKMHIEGIGHIEPQSPGLQYMFVDMVPGSPVQSTTPPLDQAYRGFVSFGTPSQNDNSYGMVADAVLRFNMDGANSVGQILIIPMYIDVHDGELWENISNPAYYDIENAVSVQISNTVDVDVQIESVFNRCLTYGTGTIALIIPQGNSGKINDPSTMQLMNLDIWRTQ